MRARIADIITHACQLSGIDRAAVLGPGRREPVVRVRHAVCLIAREQTISHDGLVERAYSSSVITRALRRHDHSTVLSALKRAEAIVERDPAYAAFVDTLRERVNGSKPFAGIERTMPVVFNAPPSPSPSAPSVKAVRLQSGEAPDEGHRFHDAIGRGTDLLTAALAKAGVA